MDLTNKIPAINRISNRYNEDCINAVNNYFLACRNNKQSSMWAVRMYTSLNLFLWHLDAFAKDEDPNIEFVEKFNKSAELISSAGSKNLFNNAFVSKNNHHDDFETQVSGLFSDIWVDMSDDIYFDETYSFTYERLSKNDIDPNTFFKDKVVVDAGCGSGKFSATIAKLGARKVYGIDIGKKGLEFARKQALKKEYGSNIEYIEGSLLNIPLNDSEVDMVWSNGVIHHTLDYNKCLSEFNRIIKSKGELFLYVNGSFGLFELLQDVLRVSNEDIPRELFQNYIKSLGVNSGRLYWLMDCLYAPYEYKSIEEVKEMLTLNGFHNFNHLTRGVAIDQIEQVTNNLPYAREKYGDSQIKIICNKKN
jgi:ubiquinone/menaquinone biosynthesis C-methylase UbiE